MNPSPDPVESDNFSHAEWIGSSVIGGRSTSAPASYFRKTFTSRSVPASAVLHATALGLYECEINGHRVGDNVLAPGWTDYRLRVHFQTHDVTSLVGGGENTLGAILGDGWYCGHVAHKGRQFYGDRPQLLVRLVLTYEDGSEVSIVSDRSWKTSTGPILENDLLMGEAYDARLGLGPWSVPGYDDEDWLPVKIASNPDIEIVRSPSPPVREIERLEPLAGRLLLDPTYGNSLVFDFQQNFAGRVELRVKAPRGTHLVLRHAEVCNADGTLYTENLRTARATDFYTCSGESEETWQPRFTFHGFRYLEIKGLGPDDTCAVSGVVLHSDLHESGTFRCSHPLLNQLAKNIRWGLKGNFLDVPTDCPQRDERLGWTGDAQVFIRTAAFYMDVDGFFSKWLQDMRDAQESDGAIPCVIPNALSYGLSGDGGPAWADATFICPWTLYLCYGNTDILRAHYDCMARYMTFLAEHRVKDFIRSHPDVDRWGGFGDWLAIDGGPTLEGRTPKDLIGTAMYSNNAQIMARCAEILDRQDEAEHWRELHQNIGLAFQKRFVSSDGKLASGTQTAYVLALHFGLVPEPLQVNAARELARNIEANDCHLATGFVGTPYLLHVLEAHGYLGLAYRVLEQESYPSWLFPVTQGATTVWERWDGWTLEKGFQEKTMNSFNHYAYGAVGDWLVSTVAGLDLDPARPGFKHTVFKPRPGGSISSAEARLHSPLGEVAISWWLEGGTMRLELLVPEGCTATLSLPPEFENPTPSLSPGRHTLRVSHSESLANE